MYETDKINHNNKTNILHDVLNRQSSELQKSSYNLKQSCDLDLHNTEVDLKLINQSIFLTRTVDQSFDIKRKRGKEKGLKNFIEIRNSKRHSLYNFSISEFEIFVHFIRYQSVSLFERTKL